MPCINPKVVKLDEFDSLHIDEHNRWIIIKKNSSGCPTYVKTIEPDNTITEEWMEYDNRSKLIHHRDSENNERWHEYDDKGQNTHSKYFYSFDNETYEEWIEYDNDGNEIHCKDSSGYENFTIYDDNGKTIQYLDALPSGDIETKKNEYDERGNLIHILVNYQFAGNKEVISSESWYTYDDMNREISYQDSYGLGYNIIYDKEGNDIKHIHSSGLIVYRYFNKDGKLVQQIDNEGELLSYFYDENNVLLSQKYSSIEPCIT